MSAKHEATPCKTHQDHALLATMPKIPAQITLRKLRKFLAVEMMGRVTAIIHACRHCRTPKQTKMYRFIRIRYLSASSTAKEITAASGQKYNKRQKTEEKKTCKKEKQKRLTLHPLWVRIHASSLAPR
jgi:DNA-directed RNA polymerase subunit M/transcription elongation factor TFIIS